VLINKTEFGRLETDVIESPIGEVLIVVSKNVLLALDFSDYESRMMKLLRKRLKSIELHAAQNPGGVSDRVTQYFAGNLNAFDDLPMSTGGTSFQQQVWQQLEAIPPGELRTYGDLAHNLGKPGAAQAVGMANSLNPISIALPCHRVIGANGSLTGYAGGLERKQWLLNHEGANVSASKSPSQQLSMFS